MEKVLYFGYGANRNPKMMEWITGNPNLIGRQAVLKGYTLCVQRLDQIPDSAREKVAVNWPTTFTSYNIKEDQRGEVHGTIWELTPEERELVRDWELIDFGWYKDIKSKVIAEDGQEVPVQTEGLREGQGIDREVDGTNYETWLNPPEEFERIATKSRQEYFARQKTLEGAATSPKDKELT